VFLPAEGDEGRSLFAFNGAADERSFWHRARIDTFTGLGCGLNEQERFVSGQEQEIASREVLVLACGCCSPSTGRGAAGAEGRIGLSLCPLECQEKLG